MPLIDPQDDDILSLDTHVVSADGNLTSQANPHFRLIHVEGISRHRLKGSVKLCISLRGASIDELYRTCIYPFNSPSRGLGSYVSEAPFVRNCIRIINHRNIKLPRSPDQDQGRLEPAPRWHGVNMDTSLINAGHQRHGISARGCVYTNSTSSTRPSIELRGDHHTVQPPRPNHCLELDQEHHIRRRHR